MKRFAYRQIIFQMVTKLSNLSPAFGKHAANQIPRNESGSVCSAAIFSETSAPFLMRGVFSIPQKSRAVFTARLKYFQHQKSVVPPPKNSPMPRGARDIAPARTRLPYNRTPATASVSPAARAAPARPRPPKRRQRRNPNARPTPRWTAKSPWRRKTRTPTDRPQRPRKPPPHAPAPGTAPARRRTAQRTTVKTAASVSASTR